MFQLGIFIVSDFSELAKNQTNPDQAWYSRDHQLTQMNLGGHCKTPSRCRIRKNVRSTNRYIEFLQ
jgi:hypothetical protein